MTQEFRKFTPDTVDERIEQISDPAPVNTRSDNGISGEHIVRSLRHLYQLEQRDRALARGWERIVQTSSNDTIVQDITHLKQDHSDENSQDAMNVHAYRPVSGSENQHKPDLPAKGKRRIGVLVQTLAAIVIIGVLLASFLAFIVYHAGTPGAKNQRPQPAVHSIIATVALDGTVYAFQPGSKRILWSFSQAVQKVKDSLTCALVVQGHTVYVVLNGQVYALNASDGTMLWQQNLAPPNSVQNSFDKLISDHDVLYVSGTAYVGKDLSYAQSSGNIYAIRASDGKILWHHQDATPDPLITALNKNVYVKSGSTLLVLNGDTGKLRWKKASMVPSAIVADDTTAYVDAQLLDGVPPGNKNKMTDATLLALNTQDGHVRWSTPVINLKPIQSQTFTLHQGMIILSFMSDYPYTAHLCAYKTSDGTSVWCSPKIDTPTEDGILNYIVMNNTIYSQVYLKYGVSVEARNVVDGKLLWSIPSSVSGGVGAMTGSNGVIYILNRGVSAFDGRNGHELWRFSMGNQSLVMLAFAVGS